MEKMYVLEMERKDFITGKYSIVYYKEGTPYFPEYAETVEQANKYSLKDALAVSRILRSINGEHYVLRLVKE